MTENNFGKHSVNILFAYIKANGQKTGDNKVRLVLEESRPHTWTHTAFVESNSTIRDLANFPYEYGDQFNSDTPILKWMLAERAAGRLLDGNTYTYKNKTVTILLPYEYQDIVNKGLVYTKGHYETSPY